MAIALKYSKRLSSFFLVLLLGASCEKDVQQMSDFDNNKLNLVIADNFNLSSFSAALRKSGMDKVLNAGEGPFTVLAPSDAAFITAGYAGPTAVLSASNTVVSRIANYHTLDGKYELNKLPFAFNQELRSRGGKMFATHWVKGQDTVLTLNGARILSTNLPASNGLVQVLDRVLTPYVHDVLVDALAADASITLFTQALRTSGMLEQLRQTGPYTVFAPVNTAMQSIGYASVEQIEKTDPKVLLDLVSYHIVRDRRFVYDYVLSAGPSNTAQQGMMNGNSVTVRLVPNPSSPGAFSGISLRGIGNTTDVLLTKQDMLTGNGILHVINGTLRLTQ
ncbi:fasciclin domain-containing protein [Sphingobacterium psychroaquaticum]|uniref:fasciclin domain-containing protein n=1 Tax=Sphingobacterium psychroaquaticum TaxID=561061 RepID=UPI00106CABCB|nr:fasciclin domain-containing protein [Sphingobacterium psychroaquaticum]QBQ42037.1 fasciclin domain-containing protein [Sphingobacterium psychroaquaticum]